MVALGAVGLLLYAAVWLNARANLSAFMGELRGKMKDALGSGSAVGLFTISFTSVGRETVETALFLQGLAGDSREGVWWGSLVGGVALLLAALGALAFVARVALGASLRRFGVDDLALGGVDGAARLAFARGTRRRARVGLAQQICARVGELAGDGERVRRGVACL